MLMSIEEASKYLGMSEETVRYLARSKRIPAGKIGRKWRLNKDDLDSFLREQYDEPQPTASAVNDGNGVGLSPN
jgi:excisionase family DNA binding protein